MTQHEGSLSGSTLREQERHSLILPIAWVV